jgi:hypothetical protein
LAKVKGGTFLKQGIGNRDTKHGMLDLPVTLEKKMKKPKMRFQAGGFVDAVKRAWNRKKEEKPAPEATVPSTPAPENKKVWKAAEDLKGSVKVMDKIEGMKKGGTVRCRDGCAVRGLTKGRMR